MILTINLLLHHYQGNAWHHAHCEGLVDWPPAPWRILRALVAGAYTVGLPPQHQPALKQLLHTLAQYQPTYRLPDAAYIQHRSPRPQVRPGAKIDPGKTLYSAGFLVNDGNPQIQICYPFDLTPTEDLILRLILNGLTYLGRKESAAEWTLTATGDAAETGAAEFTANAIPDASGTRIVAIPDPNLDADALWQALNLSAADVFAKNKQAVFPGILQTAYRLEPRSYQPASPTHPGPKAVRLQVISDYGVPKTLALELCDRLHRSLVKRCPDPVFTGQSLGQPLPNHNHTFIQPRLDRSKRYIEGLELASSQGYASTQLDTIVNSQGERLQQVYVGGQFVALELVDLIAAAATFHCWESVTPMFLTRFPKTRRGKPRYLPDTPFQVDGPEHQALKYLLFLGHLGLSGAPSFRTEGKGLALWLDGERAAVVECSPWEKIWQWKTERDRGKKVGRAGYSVKLAFTQPVVGPIGLGYACHYGLGAMLPPRTGSN